MAKPTTDVEQLKLDLETLLSRVANLEKARAIVDRAKERVASLQRDLKDAKRKLVEAGWNLSHWQRAVESSNTTKGGGNGSG